jgi:predicted transcriptional regulator of viral defense system
MKYRSNILILAEEIKRLSPEMKGVFSYSDLAAIVGVRASLKTSRIIRRLETEKILFRVQKGIYMTKGADLWMLSHRLSKDSYISMDSVLAKNGLIGTLPLKSVSAVHCKRNNIIKTAAGNIYFHSLSKHLFCGVKRSSSGLFIADSEKAFLDLLYYYSKGITFVIDPLREVAIYKLNKRNLFSYLRNYKNPKFKVFVKGVINER